MSDPVAAPAGTQPVDEASTLRIAHLLMGQMGCRVDSDHGECPSCDTGYCPPHGPVWFCWTHDWVETGHAEGLCGHAYHLAQTLTTAGVGFLDGHVIVEVGAYARQKEANASAANRAAEADQIAARRTRQLHGLREKVTRLLDEGPDTWTPYDSRDTGQTFLAESVFEFTAALRDAVAEGAPR